MNISTGKKAKVNIHYVLSEPLLSYCVNLNRSLNGLVPGLLGYNSNSIALPHLSIFMGYVNSYEMLEQLFQIVEALSINIRQFRLTPTHLYFKGSSEQSSKYLFIDTLQSDAISETKERFFTAIGNSVIPIGWDMRGEPPHITVACYKILSQQIKSYVETYSFPPECTIRQIGISLSGKHGVCLGQMKTFDLQTI